MTTVLMSGAIAAGKTTVAKQLALRTGARLIAVRGALAAVVGVDLDRRRLQEEGARLDRRTNGAWLAHYVLERADDEDVIVDALRTVRQTLPTRDLLPNTFLVFLDASASTRAARFALASRSDPVKRSLSFAEAMRHDTERDVQDLKAMADLVLPTDELSADEVVGEIVAAARLAPLAPDE